VENQLRNIGGEVYRASLGQALSGASVVAHALVSLSLLDHLEEQALASYDVLHESR
jgi:hypothetical protein